MNTKSAQLFGVGLDAEIKRVCMKLQMQMAKKNDGLSLRNLGHILCVIDSDGNGLDQEQFEKGLRQYG